MKKRIDLLRSDLFYLHLLSWFNNATDTMTTSPTP